MADWKERLKVALGGVTSGGKFAVSSLPASTSADRPGAFHNSNMLRDLMNSKGRASLPQFSTRAPRLRPLLPRTGSAKR